MPVGRGRNDPIEAERIAQVGSTKTACGRGGCVRGRGRAACVDVAAPSQKVAGPDEGQVDSLRLELHKVGARNRV